MGQPDVQQIVKQMAIVAWQPGPNRVLRVPSQSELDRIRRSLNKADMAGGTGQGQASQTYGPPSQDPSQPLGMAGTVTYSLAQGGQLVVERKDIWGYYPPRPGPEGPPETKGLHFGP